MYVYDQARTLAKAIKDSPEYKLLKHRKDAIENDGQLKKMFSEYRAKQFEIQKLQVLGQKVPEDKMQSFRQMHDLVTANSPLRDFIEAEQRFATMMADLQRIMVEGLELG